LTATRYGGANPVDGSPIGGGSSYAYGDPFDLMGGGGLSASHFNAWFKTLLGWMPSAEVETVISGGTYRIHGLESAIAYGRHALKIPRDASKAYWVEFRPGYGTASLSNGAVFHWGYASSAQSYILDMTPGTASGLSDAALPIGRTFSDSEAGIHVTPVGKGGTTPETLDLVVNLGTFPGNAAPSVTVSASSVSIAAGGTVAFTAAATDPNGDVLAYGWDFGDGTTGSNASSVSKTFPAAGDFAVQCTVTDMLGGTARDSVVVRVGSPATHRLSGRVTAGGAPVAGVRVSATSAYAACTDSDGTYTIAGVPAGTYTISTLLPNYAFSPSGFSNPLAVSANKTGLDFTGAYVPPGPDLVIKSVTASLSGTSLSLGWQPANVGQRDTATPFAVGFYL
ncbi:MAG: PKD domain-containing protein, partial [Planctomycetota bacterium]